MGRQAELKCSICFDDADDTRTYSAVNPCGHIIHTHCLAAFEDNHNQDHQARRKPLKCPVCRTSYKSRIKLFFSESKYLSTSSPIKPSQCPISLDSSDDDEAGPSNPKPIQPKPDPLIASLKSKISSLEVQITSLNLDLTTKSNDLFNAHRDIRALTDRCATSESQKLQVREELRILGLQEHQTQRRYAAAKADASKARNENMALMADLQRTNERLRTLQENLLAADRNMEALETEKKAAEIAKAEFSARFTKQCDSNTKLKAKNKALIKQVEELLQAKSAQTPKPRSTFRPPPTTSRMIEDAPYEDTEPVFEESFVFLDRLSQDDESFGDLDAMYGYQDPAPPTRPASTLHKSVKDPLRILPTNGRTGIGQHAVLAMGAKKRKRVQSK